jgi:Lon protease-like protein
MLQSVLETDRRFGVVRWDPHTQSMASIGCCAEVIQHQTGEDGRSNIVTLGQQRFRVLNVTRETPFRTAMVSWIEDDPVEDMNSLHSLTESVASALKDVVELTGKLTDTPTALPEDLPDLTWEAPLPISNRNFLSSLAPAADWSKSSACSTRPAVNWQLAPCCETPCRPPIRTTADATACFSRTSCDRCCGCRGCLCALVSAQSRLPLQRECCFGIRRLDGGQAS